MAEIEWKGAIWKAAYGKLSIRDLLTILKGYGPMEILEFEKPGTSHGQLSLCIFQEETKEVTLHDLKVHGERRRGKGRKTLRWLKTIFKGDIYVDYPELTAEQEAAHGSLSFWVEMYREGLIKGLDGGLFCLYPEMGEAELREIEDKIIDILSTDKAMSGRNESQR